MARRSKRNRVKMNRIVHKKIIGSSMMRGGKRA